MALLDFIQRLLGLQKPSATTAKERLQLVLAHDRSDLNPELLEKMRREILEVVQKYVEIDLEGGDVSLATEDRVTALVANLPIRRARPMPRAVPADVAVVAPPLENENVSKNNVPLEEVSGGNVPGDFEPPVDPPAESHAANSPIQASQAPEPSGSPHDEAAGTNANQT